MDAVDDATVSFECDVDLRKLRYQFECVDKAAGFSVVLVFVFVYFAVDYIHIVEP